MDCDKKVNEIVDAITEIIIQHISVNKEVETSDEDENLQVA
ncbi:MAG: hypothetical protein ACRC7N_11130 [Clostridium sp.]